MQNTANKIECKSIILTTNSTVTPWNTSVQLQSVNISVVTPGTTWVLTIKDKAGTPVQFFSKTLATGDNISYIMTDANAGVEMTGGVDVVGVSGTPGEVHLKLTAMRLGHD